MTNADIAAVLAKIGKILSLKGENPFRIRAYERAAMTIESLPRTLKDMYGEEGLKGLQEIPGIGIDLSQKIEELVKTGKLMYLTKLEQTIPPGVLAMTDIPGLGPKKIAFLWKNFNVETIEDLGNLAKSGKLNTVKGWGEKSVENILKGIKVRAASGGRIALPVALAKAEEIVEALRKTGLAEKLEIAGSVRRRRETSGDIDILATSKKTAAMMDAFCALPQAVAIVAKGKTRSAIRLAGGLNADLRVVDPKVFGAALYYFTGSKEHNVHMRGIAVSRGITINEYGVFKGTAAKKGKQLAAATEQDIFAVMGLPYIPPELREDRGEIEAAARGALPHLIEDGDLKGDLHMHSTFSDGGLTMTDMAKAAERAGLEYIAMTDHASPMGMVRGVKKANVREYVKLIEEAQRNVPNVQIIAGVEVDILPDGRLYLDDATLGKLEWVIASVHGKFNQTREEMTERLLRAIRHPRVNLIAHPTTRLLAKRPGIDFDIDVVFKEAAKRGVAMELNASIERLDLNDVLLKRAKELGVVICINSDAHSSRELNYRFGIAQAKRGWIEKKDVINTLPLKQFLKQLKRHS